MEFNALPETCTSFFAYEFAVDSNFNVYEPESYGYDYGKLHVNMILQFIST